MNDESTNVKQRGSCPLFYDPGLGESLEPKKGLSEPLRFPAGFPWDPSADGGPPQEPDPELEGYAAELRAEVQKLMATEVALAIVEGAVDSCLIDVQRRARAAWQSVQPTGVSMRAFLDSEKPETVRFETAVAGPSRPQGQIVQCTGTCKYY